MTRGAYPEIVVQDGLVGDVDGELHHVREAHAGRGKDQADALEDDLDLLQRGFRHRAVQARTDLSIAEQQPGVRRHLDAVRRIVGMGTNAIVERMDRQHRRSPPRLSERHFVGRDVSPETDHVGSSGRAERSRESLMRMQPMVIGHHYMASAGQYLATEAAHAILRAGGNAIDAGVAGGIALGVVHSDQVQFSGVAPMLIYLADRNETVSIAGLGWWPKALNIETVHPRPQRHDPRGPPAHGGSGGARRLDPGAATLRHHELRRGRGGGHPLCARRLCRAHRHGDVPAGQGRGLPALAAERRDLAARRQAARAKATGWCRPISAARSSSWPTRRRRRRAGAAMPA